MKRIIPLLTIFVLILYFQQPATAQNSNMILALEDGHEMKIDGTSNVRDWEADVKTINARFTIEKFDLSDLTTLTPDHFKFLNITIPVKDIESDSGRLTKNMQGYLKKDEHPVITFSLNNVDSLSVENDRVNITASGVINAAGKDHTATLNLTGTVTDSGKLTFTGNQKLLMTDFGIKPPTALLGTIKAEDEVSIIYSLTFSQQ